MQNKASINEKAVSSHHMNAGVFSDRYKVFDVNPHYSAFTYDRKRLFHFLSELTDTHLKPGAKVLDVGSGTGYFLNLLHKKNFNVIGVEPAQAMRKSAMEQYPYLTIQEAGVGSLPFETGTFDAVFAIEVFRYLNLEEQERGYKECLRVLKPGGMLVVTLVNTYACDGFYFKYKFFELLEKLHIKQLPNYCNFRTPNSIRNFLTLKNIAPSSNIETYGVLFAPVRLVYKISRKLGEWFSRKIEAFDESLTSSAFHKKFAGYLVLVVRK